MTSATSAAQNGERFRIAEMMIGWAWLRPRLYNKRPDMPDGEDDRQIAVIGGFSEQGDEVAATGRAGRQQRNRHQQRDLGQAHELHGVEMPGGRKRKWLLGRVQAGGHHRIEASEPVVDR